MNKRVVRLAIREFVESMFMEGDLTAAGTIARALEGMRVHKGIQADRGDHYAAEVPVSFTISAQYTELQLFGRIDGLTVSESGAIVEEIKSVRGALPEGFDGAAVHWAQAKAYAAIYCMENGVEQVSVHLIYFDTIHSDTTKLKRSFAVSELRKWLLGLCEKYLRAADGEEERLQACSKAIQDKGFPYESIRPGQQEMLDAVYDQIKCGGFLYVSAPTGTGKTMGALFPAVKAMAERHVRKLFYLTARNPVKAVAESSLKTLLKRGFGLRGIVLASKESLCPMPEGTTCRPDACKRAEGFFDRLSAALDEIQPTGCMGRRDIEKLAQKHNLCPHELSLSIAEVSDVVICDYNNAFDPRVRIRRFFDRGGEYALLVDEAHNLVDRGRDMFSAAITQAAVKAFIESLPLFTPGGISVFADAARALLESLQGLTGLLAEAGADEIPLGDIPYGVLKAVEELLGASEPVLTGDAGQSREFKDLYYPARFFMETADELDDRFRVILRNTPNGLELHIRCIDPSKRLRDTLDRVSCAIFYSATLTPFSYYALLTGTGGDAAFLSLPSPFPQENLKVAVLDVDTTYSKREASLDKLVGALGAFVRGRKGNYLVFFPSYRYMREAHTQFAAKIPGVFSPIQKPGMTERDRSEFLRLFDAEHEGGMAAFAVMGGIFGEGIDLAGEKVIGVAIAGVGMPQICLERSLIQQYHDERDEPGYDFAYVVPGFNRVMQAVGRLIRSETDRGVVLLADRRFGRQNYEEIMPEWWKPVELAANASEVSDIMKKFWAE